MTDFASKDVTSLSVSGDHRLNFAKEEDKWVNTDDREMPLNQTLVSSLVNNIAGITTESVVEQPEDLSEYGLDNPVRTIKATLENGSSIIIYVGNQNDLTGDYYIRLEGDDRVYGISSYVVTAFDKEPEEFIEETEEETTSRRIRKKQQQTQRTRRKQNRGSVFVLKRILIREKYTRRKN